ncbi:MAG: hypothetical protein KJ727_04750 [Acidobacteria bacterium]|nr:hypothetical protein [Acidobacteriota bacterium]
MKKHFTKFLHYFVVLLIAVLFLGGGPVKFGQENTFFHGFLIKKPIIRVGLGVNLGDVEISSSSGMKIYEVKSNYKLIADDVKKRCFAGIRKNWTKNFSYRWPSGRAGKKPMSWPRICVIGSVETRK